MLRFVSAVLLITVCTVLRAQPATPLRPAPDAIREWQSRKFGMFIHFGLYSTLGGVWQGKQISGTYSEQIQMGAHIPEAEYVRLAGQFRPDHWDPDGIVKLAQEAGMQFIVLTAKHHDGFNLFATKQSKFNVVDGTPYKRDLVKSLADACARRHMAFGVYYSTIDWNFGDLPQSRNDNPVSAAHESFNAKQLRELMTGYGPLTEIWFDMGHPTKLQSQHFADAVHQYQPNCMVSGRVWNSQGDFLETGDDEIPEFISDEPWESPASIYQETWGYRSWQEHVDLQKKVQEHIARLVTVVSRGGNYILNIGPKGDGSVVDYEADVLKGVGAWVRTNRAAIYGTQPQPFRRLEFGYATTQANRLFLFVERVPASGKLTLPGLRNRVIKANLLGDRRQTLPVGIENGVPWVGAPHTEGYLPVIEIEFAGNLDVRQRAIEPGADDRVELEPDTADHYFNTNGEGYYDPPTLRKERWTFSVRRSGRYSVELVTGAGKFSRLLQVNVNGQLLNATVYGDDRNPAQAGVVDLAADQNTTLTVERAAPAEWGEVLDVPIRIIELKLVRP